VGIPDGRRSGWARSNPSRLTVTVYLDDDEAVNIWREEIGLSPASDQPRRIRKLLAGGSPHQGPDGVCGPCSEIYYSSPGGKKVEIWNLVFTQFNRVGNPPNNLRPLPKKNIDTGMGLERTAAVLQGVESNFEIDTLKPLCLAAGDILGVKYDFSGPTGRPLRRIADHVRACTPSKPKSSSSSAWSIAGCRSSARWPNRPARGRSRSSRAMKPSTCIRPMGSSSN
jgi:alanyl-tRNA synthetase